MIVAGIDPGLSGAVCILPESAITDLRDPDDTADRVRVLADVIETISH